MGRERRREAARAGVTGAVFAGAALAVLQILQQAIGPFDPKPVLTGLIVVAVGLGGLALDRWRSLAQHRRERDAKLEAALRVWPLPRVRDADSLALGVFPRRALAGAPSPDGEDYVPRTVDGRLRRALEPGSLVLVFGPARAGKSRTALAAARSRMPDDGVIVPATCEGLEQLLEVGLPLGADGEGAILWLDGLERYVDAIDSETLDKLCEPDAALAVVATIRTDEWRALLASPGQKGEAAKAVAARARAFRVPHQLDDRECRDAKALYPRIDLTAGIGRALSASGMEQQPPVGLAAPTAPQGIRPPERPIWSDQLLAVEALGGLLAVFAFFAVWIGAGFSCLPIGTQLGNIKQEGTRGGRAVKVSQVDFHGAGEPSYLLVFRDKRIFRRSGPNVYASGFPHVSDELRVYDRDGDKLVQRFRFRPVGRTAIYGPHFAGDFDDDGADEIIGAYGRPPDSGQARIPFSLDWDDARERYKLISLQPAPPRLEPLEFKGLGADAARVAYEQRATFRNVSRPRNRLALRRERGLRLTGHKVHNLAVTSAPKRLLLGYLVEPRNQEEGPKLELRSFLFDRTVGEPRPIPCSLSGLRERRLQVNVEAGAAPEYALLEAWAALTKRRKCIPSADRPGAAPAGGGQGQSRRPFLWPPKPRRPLAG